MKTVGEFNSNDLEETLNKAKQLAMCSICETNHHNYDISSIEPCDIAMVKDAMKILTMVETLEHHAIKS